MLGKSDGLVTDEHQAVKREEQTCVLQVTGQSSVHTKLGQTPTVNCTHINTPQGI